MPDVLLVEPRQWPEEKVEESGAFSRFEQVLRGPCRVAAETLEVLVPVPVRVVCKYLLDAAGPAFKFDVGVNPFILVFTFTPVEEPQDVVPLPAAVVDFSAEKVVLASDIVSWTEIARVQKYRFNY